MDLYTEATLFALLIINWECSAVVTIEGDRNVKVSEGSSHIIIATTNETGASWFDGNNVFLTTCALSLGCFPPSKNGILYSANSSTGELTVDFPFINCSIHENNYTVTTTEGSDIFKVECTSGNGGNGGDNCIVILIILMFFAVSLIVMTITFFVVLLLSCKFPSIGKTVIIVWFFIIDVVFEIIILWGIEYGSNFKLFKSDSECPVFLIGVVCHLVTLLIEVVKAVVLYRYIYKLKKRFFGNCIAPESKPTEKAQIDVNDRKTRSNLISKGSEGRSPHSAEDRTEKDAKPEDVMILMHFTLPEGYSVDTWASEKTSSINDSSKYRPSDRGSLCIKAATKTDNGIYQSILKSNDSEQRINAVLHVTERKSVSLVIHPLVWRRLSSKKLKKMSELKDVRHKLSTNDGIEMKQEDKSNISVRSVRWKHNGRGIPSNSDNDNKEVCSLEVTKRDPIDEYHCTVEFSNKKSHMYIFIVKFTGARSGITSEDVIGVPTIMNTKREEIIPSLPPIRHTGTTASANQDPESSPVQGNDLHQVTARSTQSTGTEVNT